MSLNIMEWTTSSDADSTMLVSDTDSFDEHLDNTGRHSEKQDEQISLPCIRKEARLLFELTVPMIVLQVGFTMSPFLLASFVGRKFGAAHLSGFSLANLTGNMFAMSLLQGLFSASDTLSPRAFGSKNYAEVGFIAMRTFFCSLMLVIPVNLFLVPSLEPLLEYTGQDSVAAQYAADWYKVYAFSLPFYALYMSTWKFLSSQNIMGPIVAVCLVSCGIILPVSLKVLTAEFGFVGSSYSFLFFQAFQAMALLSYLWYKHPHVPGTWPGKGNWRHAFHSKALKEFLYLSTGGMAANLEWLAWEAISLVVGKLGMLPLSVHTIPTQVIMACYMLPFGIGVALSLRLGSILQTSVKRAKILAGGTVLVSSIFLAGISYLLYAYRFDIYAIFTSDPQVVEGAEKIWWIVCAYNFASSLFGILSGIATGLGMQWTLATVNTFCMWLIGMPMVYYRGVACGGGLESVWIWISIPYVVIDSTMMIAFLIIDWDHLVKKDKFDIKGDECRSKNVPEAAHISNKDRTTYGTSICIHSEKHDTLPALVLV